MKLKGRIASLDEVPEAYHQLYIKTGDGYELNEVELEDTTGLKNSVVATRKERDEARALAKRFEGVDLEAYQKWQEDKQAAEAELAKSKGDWDSREKQLKAMHAKEVAAKEEELARVRKALHSEMIESKARAAIAEAKGDDLFMLPHIVPSLKIVEENGTFVVRVLDGSGNPRLGDVEGNPMTISQLVSEKKADPRFARAFEASGVGGTGSPPGDTGAKGAPQKVNTIKRSAFNDMDPAQQYAHVKAGGTVTD